MLRETNTLVSGMFLEILFFSSGHHTCPFFLLFNLPSTLFPFPVGSAIVPEMKIDV
jgi:hypothetical protein